MAEGFGCRALEVADYMPGLMDCVLAPLSPQRDFSAPQEVYDSSSFCPGGRLFFRQGP